MKELLNEISYTAIDTRARKLHSGGSDVNGQDMPVISVGGILMDPDRYWSLSHSDTLPDRCTIADIADSSGEWTAIAEQRDGDYSRYLALSDYAGYAPIFYSMVPGKSIVLSDSFSGAVQGLRSVGGDTTLNLGNYLTLITGRARTFETLIASETMANEIHILPPGDALVIEHDAVRIIDREKLSPAAGQDNYEKALDASVQYTSKTISRLLSANNEAAPIITLTGGVDSRLVLALLGTTDSLEDFGAWSLDPRDSKSESQRRIFTVDVEIANQIRRSYGLPWALKWEREKVSVSLAEALARHQSYRSNYYFQFYTAKHIQVEKDPVLTLRGGGGEILRGTSSARIGNTRFEAYVAAGGKLEDTSWAAQDFLERSFLSNALRPVAEDFLAKHLNTPHNSSVREKLDEFYKNHRNRAHFGHHRVSEGRNDHILQVLSNPYMQRLVDLTDYDYVSSSRIVLDIFQATDPELRKFPFESKSAHEKLYLASSEPFEYRDRDSWIEDFDAMKSRSDSYPFVSFAKPGFRGEDIAADVQQDGMLFVRQGFRIIEDLVAPEFRRALQLQHERVRTRLENKQIPLGKSMAIIASATDIVAPMPLGAARHFFTTYDGRKRIPPRNLLHDAAGPYRVGV